MGEAVNLHPRYAPGLIGHQTIGEQLKTLYQANRFPHGLLFTGAPGIGKATFSHQLAKALLTDGMATLGETATQRGAVHALLQAGNHPDCLIVEKSIDENGKTSKDIPLEKARSVTQFFAQKSLANNWRIAIIDSVDDLSAKGANALLKILEEPPEKALLILISHNLNGVLPTLRSRTMVFGFAPLDTDQTATVLKRIIPGHAAFLSQVSQGRPGLALGIERLGGENFYQAFLKLIESLAKQEVGAIYPFIERQIFKNATLSAEQAYDGFIDFFSTWMVMTLTRLCQGHQAMQDGQADEELLAARALFASQPAEHWIKLWFAMHQTLKETHVYSLDKKQTLVCIFHELVGLIQR
jgi:DNA polymerase III, gamma/tau subunits